MSGADLSPEDRQRIDDFLSKPMEFPSEFRNWVSDYLSVNIPQIPVSQLLGYKGTLAHNVIDNAEIQVNSADGPEREWNQFDGPAVTGLADGTYFVSYGAKTGRAASGGVTTRIGISVNGSDPVSYATFQGTDEDAMIWRADVVTAQNADVNSFEMYYWYDGGGGFLAQFLHRWVTVLRIS